MSGRDRQVCVPQWRCQILRDLAGTKLRALCRCGDNQASYPFRHPHRPFGLLEYDRACGRRRPWACAPEERNQTIDLVQIFEPWACFSPAPFSLDWLWPTFLSVSRIRPSPMPTGRSASVRTVPLPYGHQISLTPSHSVCCRTMRRRLYRLSGLKLLLQMLYSWDMCGLRCLPWRAKRTRRAQPCSAIWRTTMPQSGPYLNGMLGGRENRYRPLVRLPLRVFSYGGRNSTMASSKLDCRSDQGGCPR